MQDQAIRLRLDVPNAAPSRGTARILTRSRTQRAGRAFTALGVCWGIGLATVFIPIVHFVVPLSMLVLGAILAVVRWRGNASLTGQEVACPRCLVAGKLVTSGPLRDGGKLHCNNCGFQISMHISEIDPTSSVGAP